MRSPRLVLAVTVVGVIAAGGAGASVDAAPQAPCLAQVTPAGDGWLAERPHFQHGPRQVTQVVATPFQPDRMIATNGTDLVVTQDAGCHWTGIVVGKPGSLLSQLPPPVGGIGGVGGVGGIGNAKTSITTLAAPSAATVTSRIYVGLQDSSVVAHRPRIGWFDGDRWHWSNKGLPSSGRVGEIAASATSPSTAYAVVDRTSSLGRNAGLYATHNGGASWSLQNPSVTSSSLRDLKVDPVVPNLLYGLGPDGLVASRDGGVHFEVGTRPGRDIETYDAQSTGGSVRLVQGHAQSPAYDYSVDAGLHWQRLPALASVKDIALQPVAGQVAVSDGRSVFVLRPSRAPGLGSPHASRSAHSVGSAAAYAHLVTPRSGAPTQLQFTAPLSAGYALVGVHDGVIMRGSFALSGRPRVLHGGVPVLFGRGVSAHRFPSTLTPGKQVLALRPGASKDVHYRLLLPRSPSPVDVMFLVDTSDSTSQDSEGLRQDLGAIVRDLQQTGLDARFGVADFKDYTSNCRYIGCSGDGDAGDYPYRLDRRIAPAGPALAQAIGKLQAYGGGDPPESQLTALYQSTTGAGQVYRTHVRRHGHRVARSRVLVAPGQSAGYRPDALKLAVLATDAQFHHERRYLTPTWTDTVNALIGHGVHPIGLALQTVTTDDGSHYRYNGYQSLRPERALATATGSLAPRGGVDCNGDLTPDVAAGAPFVCKVPVQISNPLHVGKVTVGRAKVQPVQLGPAITTATESIADLRPVGLSFHGAPATVARVLSPAAPVVNLKVDNTVDFTVRYTCPKAHKPHAFSLGLDASVPGRVLASSSARLACGALPLVHHRHPGLPGSAPVAAALAPVAAAPAAPAAPGNPPPNTNPNPNPALNPNVGFASQEEHQRQLAFAGADSAVSEDTGEELAMSRLGIGTAVLMTAAAGYAARRRFAAAWHRG